MPAAHHHDVGGHEAGIHAHGWKQQEAPLYLPPDSTSHIRLSFLVNRQGITSMWMPTLLPRERQLDLRSDVETGLELFHGDTHIAKGKDRYQEATEC